MMSLRLLLPAVLMVLTAATAGLNAGSIPGDETLVVPGKGAERIVLKSKTADVLKARGNEIPRETGIEASGDVFRDIFRIKGAASLYFTRIYFYERSGVVLFSREGRVCAVAGFNERITDDGVDLGRGAEYFRFRYGNSGLSVQRTGADTAYIYYERGIAVFDDDSDDDIDMYIVFTPRARVKNTR